MRVGVGAQLLSYPRAERSGVGTYVRELLAALPAALADDELEIIWGREGRAEAAGPQQSHVRNRISPLPLRRRALRVPYEQLVLPMVARRAGLDVFHQLHPTPSLLRPAPCLVVTVHDLAAFRHPATFGHRRARYKQAMLRAAVRRASHVVTISEHARSELIELLAVAPHRVTAVHCGVDAWWRATEDPAELAGARERAGLPARYLLSVGALEPRKNLALLIEAYALARRKGLTLPLVVAGPAGWRSREIRDAPRRHGVADHVLLVGHLSRSDLRAAYSQAEAFVFPSLYEGFGLPVLEAMACGTPVIASCSSSLPEVAGDAAVLVDPADPDALAAALERVVGDETLRSDLRRRGVQRAAGFSWDEAARQTVDAYRTALAG